MNHLLNQLLFIARSWVHSSPRRNQRRHSLLRLLVVNGGIYGP